MFGKDKTLELGQEIELPVVLPDESAGGDAGELVLSGPVALDLGAIRDEPVSEGWHSVAIERCDPKATQVKELPSLFVMSRVTDESDIEFNRTIIWNCMLAGEGMVFTKRCFAALGMPTQLNYPTYQALADALIGRSVEVKVKHRTYQGTVQANVNNWRALTPEIAF